MTTPLSTATPKSAMKPTLALTLRLKSPMSSARMPPMSANGMFMMMSSACLTELNEPKRRRKIAAIVIGTTMAEAFHGALLVLELAAPGHEVTGRKFHGCLSIFCFAS